MEGPEFETLTLLGPNCGVFDWESILKATQLCDIYGIDTMHAGGLISFVMEAFEKGKITLKDTENLEIKFGNGPAMIKILQKIVDRQGIGDILAEGVKYASEKFNASELAMISKGQVFGAYDPRGAKGMALTYATSPKGAHHMNATTMGIELSSGSRFNVKSKGILQRDNQFSMCIVDSLGLCSTMRSSHPYHEQANSYSIVTGIPMDVAGLNKIAERIINLERIYNAQLGLSRKDDILPKRMLEEKFTTGLSTGQIVELDLLLDDFYSTMGWDKNGIPTDSKLKELELTQIINK
jgi:aldehyde:ferredoxin oxidoreductase